MNQYIQHEYFNIYAFFQIQDYHQSNHLEKNWRGA